MSSRLRSTAPAIYLACEAEFRQRYGIRTPSSALDYAKVDKDQVEQIRDRLTAKGFYDKFPSDLRPVPARLLKADVRKRLREYCPEPENFPKSSALRRRRGKLSRLTRTAFLPGSVNSDRMMRSSRRFWSWKPSRSFLGRTYGGQSRLTSRSTHTSKAVTSAPSVGREIAHQSSPIMSGTLLMPTNSASRPCSTPSPPKVRRFSSSMIGSAPAVNRSASSRT